MWQNFLCLITSDDVLLRFYSDVLLFYTKQLKMHAEIFNSRSIEMLSVKNVKSNSSINGKHRVNYRRIHSRRKNWSFWLRNSRNFLKIIGWLFTLTTQILIGVQKIFLIITCERKDIFFNEKLIVCFLSLIWDTWRIYSYWSTDERLKLSYFDSLENFFFLFHVNWPKKNDEINLFWILCNWQWSSIVRLKENDIENLMYKEK